MVASPELKEVSNNREWMELIDEISQKDLKNFIDYYNGASPDVKQKLDAQYNKYLGDELKQDSKLKNKLNASEIKDSSEITKQDIANLNTVKNLTDVLNNYPNISSPEHRAIKRLIDEYRDVLVELGITFSPEVFDLNSFWN